MKDEEIIQNIRKHTAFTDQQAERFFSYLRYQKLKKNEWVIRQGESDGNFILIKSGCLMTFHQDSNNITHIIQFGQAMWWTGDLLAFTKSKTSQYSVKAMIASEVYSISLPNFNRLLKEVPGLEKYFRIIFQNALVSHQDRLILNFAASAQKKYSAFQKQFAKMEVIIPQKYIASYLGITPEFLSKIRNRQAKS